MGEMLRGLSPTALLELAGAVEGRSVVAPFAPLQLRRLGFGGESARVASELQGFADLGLSAPALARVLRLLAAERQAAQRAVDRTELVWTGPETRGSRSRDTAVVVRELFASAERSVLVATYAVFQGRQVFEPLAARMEQKPDVQVRMFLNVARPHRDDTAENQLLKAFADEFRREHWPGKRLPDLYYDPRSLAVGPGPKAALHAKAIVVDDARAFVTSANVTEAAHERNIEAGVLVDSAPFATSLRLQFDSLVEAGWLRRLGCPSHLDPGLPSAQRAWVDGVDGLGRGPRPTGSRPKLRMGTPRSATGSPQMSLWSLTQRPV